MRPLTIAIPMAPPRELLPNVRRKGRGGSSVYDQAEATRHLRMAAKGAALNARYELRNQAGVLFLRPVVVAYAVIWPFAVYGASRPIPDCDGIPSAAKAALDGLIDAGVIADDGEGYVELVTATGRRGTKGEDGAILVTITEVA